MNKQEKLKMENEKALKAAMKVSDNDIIKQIEEGNVAKALKKVSNKKPSKKASTKKVSAKEGKAKVSLIYKASVYEGANTDALKKQKRQKIRKTRNKFAKILPSLQGAKNKALRKEATDAFIKFYKETYLLNDLSLESLRATNRDADTDIKLKAMLSVLKKDKVSC